MSEPPDFAVGMMSAPMEQNRATYRDRLFKPQALDMEQIVLHLIEAINLSAIMVKDVGNASQANSVFTALVLNLDSFVYPILSSEGREFGDYEDRRKQIKDTWDKSSDEGSSPYSSARKLYMLTVETLAKERLFKVRRLVYFGYGWKVGQNVKVEKLLEEEEKLGETEAEVNPEE